MCEGYVNIMRVLNVWRSGQAIYQNIRGMEILHFNQRVIKFYSFHVGLTIRVLYQ